MGDEEEQEPLEVSAIRATEAVIVEGRYIYIYDVIPL